MIWNIEWDLDFKNWSVRVYGVFCGEKYEGFYGFSKGTTIELAYNEIVQDLLRHLQEMPRENENEKIQ